MPLQANQKYNGQIIKAKLERIEKQDGGVTRSIKVRVQVPNIGFADHHIWLTPASFQRTRETLSDINEAIHEGTFPHLLRDPAQFLVGQPCRITTKANDAGEVEIQWLNGTGGKAATEDDVAAILAMGNIEDNYAAPGDGDVPY